MGDPGQRRTKILGASVPAWALALGALCLLTAFAAEAQTYQVIHNFVGGADGAEPNYGLTIDSAGNLYGTTFEGDAGTGTAYKLSQGSTGWLLSPLYVFTVVSDGVIPYSTLVPGPDGKLYGTTGFGGIGSCMSYGQSGCGTVFSLQMPMTCHVAHCSWTETPLYKFSGHADGSNPYGATLVFDQAGNLYGTTFNGGGGSCTSGCGVVFKLTPSGGSWTETVLYTFTGGPDGASPWAGVTLDAAGNLYGTTSAGGLYGDGTVYELSPAGSGWTQKTLHTFQRQMDGGSPFSGVIFDPFGSLYGATQYGGPAGGGTVFQMTSLGGSWNFKTLYSFAGSGGGRAKGPVGNLVLDSAGNLYGSTAGDGAYRFGSVFKLSHASSTGWTFTSLHDFTNGLDGGSPRSNLVFDSAGNLYGTASVGGSGNPTTCVGSCGVVWQIKFH